MLLYDFSELISTQKVLTEKYKQKKSLLRIQNVEFMF